MAPRPCTFGVIVGNRGFFPDHLAKTGREEIIAALKAAGHKAIVLSPEESKYGAVETRAEAKACAELFQKNRERKNNGGSQQHLQASDAPEQRRKHGRRCRTAAGKSQGGHERGLPPHGQVAEVVAQGDLSQEQEGNDEENGRRRGDRNLRRDGQHRLVYSRLPIFD